MPGICVSKFGEVDQEALDEILSVINGSYESLGSPKRDPVSIWIYEKSSGETSFFATHSIWKGKPRITIYSDQISQYPKEVFVAGIQRQVAHSVLHGSIEFYLVSLPDELREAAIKYRFSPRYTNSLLYQTAMIAKEYEVTKLLQQKGLFRNQVAYSKHILKVTQEDRLAWEMALRDPLLRIVYILSVVRDASGGVPLLSVPKFGSEIRQAIETRIAYLPPDYRTIIRGMVYDKIPLLGTNTAENITLVSRTISDDILEGELKDIEQG